MDRGRRMKVSGSRDVTYRGPRNARGAFRAKESSRSLHSELTGTASGGDREMCSLLCPLLPVLPQSIPDTHGLSRQPPGPNLSVVTLEKEGVLNESTWPSRLLLRSSPCPD